jgi:hypothetical protein
MSGCRSLAWRGGSTNAGQAAQQEVLAHLSTLEGLAKGPQGVENKRDQEEAQMNWQQWAMFALGFACGVLFMYRILEGKLRHND